MRSLYPPIEPFRSGMLQVSDLHTLYYEEVGDPSGLPAVFLHGGPGGGLKDEYRTYFDPERWHVVLFDQRGCGRSTPHAELRDNTTWALVADIERLRTMLGIERWVVFGGSWGSTLALAYAQTHPDRCLGLILRGIFLFRRKELLWFYQDGASRLFPEAWKQFLAPIPEVERGDLISAYHRRLTSDDPDVRVQAARAWSVWEASTSTLHPDPEAIEKASQDRFAEAFARIECHYFVHGGFLRSETQLLEDAERIAQVPGVIVQGRYDVVCPAASAWELHERWPGSELHVIRDAGHSISEPGNRDALIKATDEFAARDW